MKTMLLSHGDLVLGSSSDYEMVSDSRKVQQDVTNALVEPLGNDRFHPGWGSTIADHVGMPITSEVRTSVLTEVNRVVGNYAAVQRDHIESDLLADNQARYTTDEIVAAVSGVTVSSAFDTIYVRVGISTVSGTNVVISEVL